jgi:hypothetical protein
MTMSDLPDLPQREVERLRDQLVRAVSHCRIWRQYRDLVVGAAAYLENKFGRRPVLPLI